MLHRQQDTYTLPTPARTWPKTDIFNPSVSQRAQMQPHDLSQPSSPSSYSLNQPVRCNSLDILWSLCNNFRHWLCKPSGTAIYTYQLRRYYLTIPLGCVPKLVPLFNCCVSLDKLHISLCFNFFVSKTRVIIISTL